MSKFKVQIVRDEDSEIVREIECNDYRSAKKVESGVNVNLNHMQYTTQIVPIEGDHDQ